jgi:2,4-dienoyl-CoA reductase-like NADH-dependent reductase (Old Yellow Enzyme family)
MRFPLLESPYAVGGLALKNRIVVPPLVTFQAETDGRATPGNLAHYRSLRGAGMVVVEATAVSPEGRLSNRQLGIYDDAHLEGLSAIARAVRESGAVAAIQIHHAGRQTTTENTQGAHLLAPSAVNPGGEVPHEMDEEDIERVLDAFVRGARRARKAGFSAVELHGAHGYLGSQFLSPLANQRGDRWGGSLENRARFLREARRRVHAAVGEDVLVYCRLGVRDAEPGGLSLEEGTRVAQFLVADGVPLLHVSNNIGMPKTDPEGEGRFSYRMRLAGAVRDAVSAGVIGVGGVRTGAGAEAVLEAGLADLVAVGRAFLADPAWAEKVLDGREDGLFRCRDCRFCHHYRLSAKCPARVEAEGAATPSTSAHQGNA